MSQQFEGLSALREKLRVVVDTGDARYDVPKHLFRNASVDAVDESWLSAAPPFDSRLGLSGALAAHEKAIVEDALRASGGRVFGPRGAAARLGIPRSTLEWKIRALKINKNRFRVRAPNRS